MEKQSEELKISEQNKRKTIAFLVSGLMDDFTIQMCNGVMSEAAGADVNLVVVPVKYIDRDLSGLQDKSEYQYKTNAENLLPENTDAMIVAADCIGCLTDRDNLMLFMDALPEIPTVLIASRIDGYPGVIFDNKSGVRDGLTYMVEKLGIRRIGMLGGSENHYDAKDRRIAYDEVIRKYDLPYRDTMFVETNLSALCKKEAELLLDMNPDLEAVFCINDSVAMTLYDVLRERGMEPGRDMKILGFDNNRFAAMTTPSLSTVDADAIELGRHAFKMVMRALEGEELGLETTPTRFILRESYGVTAGHAEQSGMLDKSNIDRQFDSVFYRYRDVEEQDHSRLRNSFRYLMEDMIDYVSSEDHDPRRLREIRDSIEDFLIRDRALEYTDNDELVPFIEQLHGEIEGFYPTQEGKTQVYRTMAGIFKQILKAMSSRTVRYESGVDAMIYSMKTLVKDSLNFTYGNDKSYETIVTTLLTIGIRNACVYIYDKPIVHLEWEEFELPETVRIKAALRDGEVLEVPYSKQSISFEHIFDNPFLTDKKWMMVLMPLYFGDTVFGSILIDLTEIMFRNGEFLVNQFATTARVIGILRENNEIQKQLEENLAVMAENNIVLDRLSRNDVLTGILNRRGFFDISRSIIEECRSMKRDVILSYVDMNNLKVINDRFGHDDGDFSLKTISTVLTEVVGGSGTVGRIGGDEYALLYYGERTEEELRKEIAERFRRVNEESDKPYNITVSCGFFRIRPEDNVTLEDAMATADQDLYLAKQYKDNRVIK